MTGELRCHNVYDFDKDAVRGVCIVQADPLILVADELLMNLPTPFAEYGEGILVVNGLNATVRYRMLEHKPEGYWSAQRIDHNDLGNHLLSCDIHLPVTEVR